MEARSESQSDRDLVEVCRVGESIASSVQRPTDLCETLSVSCVEQEKTVHGVLSCCNTLCSTFWVAFRLASGKSHSERQNPTFALRAILTARISLAAPRPQWASESHSGTRPMRHLNNHESWSSGPVLVPVARVGRVLAAGQA